MQYKSDPGQTFDPQPAWAASNPKYISPALETIDPLGFEGKPTPERKWIVPGWIPHGAVTMFGGDGGVGKSLIAMQLATACATGKPWLGQAAMACKVLGVFCEDDVSELHRRQDAINRHYGVTFGDLENMQWVSRVGDDAIMMKFEYDKGEATEFFQQVHDAAQDFGAQLIVLDALHDLFGGNENARPQARQFINLLRSLALDCDGAVVLTAHPSLTGLSSGSGLSGSTAWNNAVRSRLYLTRPSAEDGAIVDENERVLKRVKANYARAGDRLDLMWRDGAFDHIGRPQGVFAGMAIRSAETAFLDALDALTKAGRNVSDSRNAGNYAPKAILSTTHGKGLKRHEIAAAMERLFTDGKICCQDYGRPSNPRRRIVRNQQEIDEDS
jgi:RecA-family ATPase